MSTNQRSNRLIKTHVVLSCFSCVIKKVLLVEEVRRCHCVKFITEIADLHYLVFNCLKNLIPLTIFRIRLGLNLFERFKGLIIIRLYPF